MTTLFNRFKNLFRPGPVAIIKTTYFQDDYARYERCENLITGNVWMTEIERFKFPDNDPMICSTDEHGMCFH